MKRFPFKRQLVILATCLIALGVIIPIATFAASPQGERHYGPIKTSVTQHTKPHFSGQYINSATAPSFTRSRYITSTDVATPSRLNTDGCNQASSGVGGIVVLDFGAIVFKNGSGYGTDLPGTTTYVSNSTIKSLVQKYLKGYQRCNSSGTVLDLGIGTNNGVFSTVADATSAGEDWATLVSNEASWITSQSIANEYALGASDIELEFNSAQLSRAWTDGFDNVSNNTGVVYLNYGDASGCPMDDSTTNRACSHGWFQSDIAYVSWDAVAAYPLPEIYATAGGNAAQWQSIDYYQHNNQGSFGAMFIEGAFTQYKACQQVGGCQGTNNTPTAGWTQLYNDLNANSTTVQSLPYLSDIQWDK